MPYRVEKRGTNWHVVKLVKTGKGSSTQSVGKHATKEEANKQLAALKVNVEDA